MVYFRISIAKKIPLKLMKMEDDETLTVYFEKNILNDLYITLNIA